MDLLLLFGSFLALPTAFILYRKFEFYTRTRKARSLGHYYVQKPIVIGVLTRWVKRLPLDVNFYNSLFRKHGHTFTTQPLFRPLVMTADPENIKTILATKFGEFDIGRVRTEVGQKYMRKGIFTTMGNSWHESRLYLRPAFNKATYAIDLGYLEGHFQTLLRNIPSNRQAFDIQPLFFEYTLNTISTMLFGISVKDLGYSEANIKAFHDAEYCMRVKGLRAVHLSTMAKGILKFYRSFEMERAGHVFDQFVEDMVAKGMDKYTSQGKQSTGSRYIFLHDAMDRTDDLARFKAEATNVLFAGRDTGAVLMSNVFWTLARNPGFWQKLQDEVATLNGDFPTYETLKNMKYLNNVLKEANRVYPVVPFNYREALVDTTLPHGGGLDGRLPLFIKSGSYVFYCTYAMHRDPAIYGDDAMEFKPERWEDPALRPGWGYLPFNGGARTCIGQNLALTEMSYTIVRMLQEFEEIWSEDPRPFKPSTNFVMANMYGARISLRRKFKAARIQT